MKILVTGGAGFIGSALVNRLTHAGHEVTVMDNGCGGMPVPKEADHFVAGDVSNWLDWSMISKQDMIFHLAASFANERSMDMPATDADSNIMGTVFALQKANEWDARLIYTGSSSSYGEAQILERQFFGKHIEHVCVPFNEDDAVVPHTPYALSKWVGEKYCEMLHGNTLILRLFNVYGPGDPPLKYRNAIPKMIAAGLLGEPITVYGDKSGRDFMYIDTLISIMVKMAMSELTGTFNVSTGKVTLMTDVAKRLGELLNVPVDYAPLRSWDKVVQRCGNNTRLMEHCYGELMSAPKVIDKLPVTIDWVRKWLEEQHAN